MNSTLAIYNIKLDYSLIQALSGTVFFPVIKFSFLRGAMSAEPLVGDRLV